MLRFSKLDIIECSPSYLYTSVSSIQSTIMQEIYGLGIFTDPENLVDLDTAIGCGGAEDGRCDGCKEQRDYWWKSKVALNSKLSGGPRE